MLFDRSFFTLLSQQASAAISNRHKAAVMLGMSTPKEQATDILSKHLTDIDAEVRKRLLFSMCRSTMEERRLRWDLND